MAYLLNTEDTSDYVTNTPMVSSGPDLTSLFLCGNDTQSATATATAPADTMWIYVNNWSTATGIKVCLYENSVDLIAEIEFTPADGLGRISKAIPGTPALTSGVVYRTGFYIANDGELIMWTDPDTSSPSLRFSTGHGDYNTPTTPIGGGSWLSYADFYWAVEGTVAPASINTGSATGITGNSATIGCNTDNASGTLFAVCDTSPLTGVTGDQIRLGRNGSDVVVPSGSAAVSDLTPAAVVTGMAASTPYYYAIVQDNGSFSNVIDTGSFSTGVATDTTPPVITILGASPYGYVAGTAGGYVDPGATYIDDVNPVIDTPVTDITGLPISDYITSHEVIYNAEDAAGNPATPMVRTVNVGPPTGFSYVTIAGAVDAPGYLGEGATGIVDGDQFIWQTASGSHTIDVKPDGGYIISPMPLNNLTFWFSAIDQAGAISDYKTAEFQVSASVPVMPANQTIPVDEGIILVGNSSTATGNAPLAYSITGGADASDFLIDENSGALSFKVAPVYASGKIQYVVEIDCTNPVGISATAQVVTIDIIEVEVPAPQPIRGITSVCTDYSVSPPVTIPDGTSINWAVYIDDQFNTLQTELPVISGTGVIASGVLVIQDAALPQAGTKVLIAGLDPDGNYTLDSSEEVEDITAYLASL